MQFRPLAAEDVEPAPAWLEGHEVRPDLWRDGHTRAAVALESGRLVATGMMWTSRVHGGRYWLDVVVDPAQRRRGIGTAMARHLTGLRAAELPFTARGFVDAPGLALADALGARTIQLVPPAHVRTALRESLRTMPGVRSVTDLPWTLIEKANADTYRWTHAGWSPVTADDDTINEDLQLDVDADASSATIANGAITALALAYRGEVPVVTAETVSQDVREGERLVEAVIRRTLDVLAARGVESVDFDGHVSDPHFLPALARLAPTGRWFRIVEIPALGRE